MLQVDISRVGEEWIGSAHGVSSERLFSDYAGVMERHITQLYLGKNDAGGWKRWLTLGNQDALFESLETYAQSQKGRWDTVIVLGIGGSSLGGYALLKALLHPYWNELSAEQRRGYPRYYFVENVDADQIAGLLDVIDLSKTLVNVISKSGTTAETMSAFMLLKERLELQLGVDRAKEHVVVTTDRHKGLLRQIADQEGYPSFEVPDDVGGRFSVFSAVGLLPAALCGVPIRQCQRGIQDMDLQLQETEIWKNPAAQLAVLHTYFYQQGKPISVFMPYSYRLAPVADWFVQLWAESLGKRKNIRGEDVFVGMTPVRAVGVTDQHSQVQLFNEGPFDKTITFVAVGQPDASVTIPPQFRRPEALAAELGYLGNRTFAELLSAEFESTRASLTRNQRPNITLTLPQVDAYHLAQLLYLLEVQTALTGALLEIDPFDQPGVELAKQYTHALMGRSGYEHLVSEARGERPSKAGASS